MCLAGSRIFNLSTIYKRMAKYRNKLFIIQCLPKIGSCFFKADKWKLFSCVSVSAITHHFEAAINANKLHLDNQSRFCCQDLIFYYGVENSGRFGHSSPVSPQLDFLMGDFNRIIGTDDIIIRAGRLGFIIDDKGFRRRAVGAKRRFVFDIP